ncbi:MAG: hypothetical protein M3159_07285, partial [Actinomycetota bacterium]|nr:hypothetical protein [Actinomycetota bacterium]
MVTTAPSRSLEAVSGRLASLLSAGGGGVGDAMGFGLEFASEIQLRSLPPGSPPDDLWAVDGGQALVADARCLQLLVTRASRVRFRAGACVVEEEGEIRAHLLGGDESRVARAGLGLTLAPDSTIDANLLRDRWEWEAVERCVT